MKYHKHNPSGGGKPPQKESNVMSNYVNTRIETKEAEFDFIAEIHKDMHDNGKHLYTNSYDFTNGDRVKITVEITTNPSQSGYSGRNL